MHESVDANPLSALNIGYSFKKIQTGSVLSRIRIPLMTLKSPNPGAVLWLTGCVHGDEVGGVVTIQEIFKRVRKRLTRGTIHAFPLMNPIGFEASARNVTFTREDLNRSFPGSVTGSLAERIAFKIFSTVIETEPTLTLDLHNDWKNSIPYCLIDPPYAGENNEVYEKTKAFAAKTGFLVIQDNERIESTLPGSLFRRKIPALTLELGESYLVNEKNVELGIKSILNILSHLEMIDPPGNLFCHDVPHRLRDRVLYYSPKPLSSTSGIIRFLAKPGDFVQKGRIIAKIYDVFGRLQENIICLDDGIVLGHSDSAVAFPGTPVMSFGLL